MLIVLAQGLVLNPMELDESLNPMIYPILIITLPFEFSVLATLIISLVIGICVDAFSNTFGLHASAAMFIGYLRPVLLRYIKPRDGYDNSLQATIHDMGATWFIGYSSLFLFLHHLWFYSFEIFRFDLIFFILAKTFFSTIFSLFLIIILQYLFYKSSKK